MGKAAHAVNQADQGAEAVRKKGTGPFYFTSPKDKAAPASNKIRFHPPPAPAVSKKGKDLGQALGDGVKNDSDAVNKADQGAEAIKKAKDSIGF